MAGFFIYFYSENGKPKYAAKLINNGKINLNANFGGVISTTREGAVINIGTGYKAKDVVTYEGITYTGTKLFLDLTKVEIKQRALGTIGYPATPEENLGDYPSPSGHSQRDFQISGENKIEFREDNTNYRYTYYYNYKYTSQAENWWLGVKVHDGELKKECITIDTNVLMADGTYKRAGDIRAGDLLTVFNHETGEFDIAPVIFNDHV